MYGDNSGNGWWTQVSVASRNDSNPINSPVYGRKTEVQCRDKNDLLETDLNNGRSCLENYQCRSRNCDWDTGICRGLQVNDTCSIHSDCDAGLYCGRSLNWPYDTRCRSQLKEGDICLGEDFECQNQLGCTKQALFPNRTCTLLYSLDDNSLFTWESLYNLSN